MRVGRPLNEHTSPFSRERALHTRSSTSKRSLSFDQFLIGGFTDPGKGYDVALFSMGWSVVVLVVEMVLAIWVETKIME